MKPVLSAVEPRIILADSIHLPVVRDLAHMIWPLAYANILTGEQIHNMLERIYSLDNLRKEIASGHQFFLAMVNEAPVGYASAFREGSTIWIKKLYVVPACTGQGIGTMLLKAATSHFLPAAQVRLLVNSNNTSAQHFYERLGFTQDGTTPVQMGDHQFCDHIYAASASIIMKDHACTN